MSKSRKSLKVPLTSSFSRQTGNCYYCSQPMWTNDPLEFSLKHNVTLPQARLFQCTGEHLIAHKDGGSTAQDNIVAACKLCNQRRHKRKVDLSPEQFKKLVRQRMSKGRWLNFGLK